MIKKKVDNIFVCIQKKYLNIDGSIGSIALSNTDECLHMTIEQAKSLAKYLLGKLSD